VPENGGGLLVTQVQGSTAAAKGAGNAPFGSASSTQIVSEGCGCGAIPPNCPTTIALVSVTLPVFLTLPVKVSISSEPTGVVGQFRVTSICGAPTSGQVAVAVVLTLFWLQALVPVAVTVLVTAHASAGAVKVAVKFADAFGARLGTVGTTVLGAGWLLATTTLWSVTSPVLLTVPV
jgi:hypothetical protein